MGTYMSMPTASHLHMLCKNKKTESKKGLCVLINNAIWWQDNEDILLANTRTAATCCQTREGSRETVTSNFKGHCTVPQMIPRRKMIPKMDRKWSSTASDPYCRPQMIPWKVEEWILGMDVPWVPEAFHARFPVRFSLRPLGFVCHVFISPPQIP